MTEVIITIACVLIVIKLMRLDKLRMSGAMSVNIEPAHH